MLRKCLSVQDNSQLSVPGLCGRIGHMIQGCKSKSKCNGMKCFRCGKIGHLSKLCLTSSSSSSFGCSHLSGVVTADVFKHPHRTFGSVLRRMPFLTQPTDSRET